MVQNVFQFPIQSLLCVSVTLNNSQTLNSAFYKMHTLTNLNINYCWTFVSKSVVSSLWIVWKEWTRGDPWNALKLNSGSVALWVFRFFKNNVLKVDFQLSDVFHNWTSHFWVSDVFQSWYSHYPVFCCFSELGFPFLVFWGFSELKIPFIWISHLSANKIATNFALKTARYPIYLRSHLCASIL